MNGNFLSTRRSRVAAAVLAGSALVAACSGGTDKKAVPVPNPVVSASSTTIWKNPCTYFKGNPEQEAALKTHLDQLAANEKKVQQNLEAARGDEYLKALTQLTRTGKFNHQIGGVNLRRNIATPKGTYEIHLFYAGDYSIPSQLTGLVPDEIIVAEGDKEGDHSMHDWGPVDGKIDVTGIIGFACQSTTNFAEEQKAAEQRIADSTAYLPVAQDAYTAIIHTLATEYDQSN